MQKTIQIKLNKFPQIPNGIRQQSSINVAMDEIDVNLSRLYHHYYTDTWGVTPIDPDHTNFEYLKFLHYSGDFRFIDARISTSEANKRLVSFKIGQAFCRYFLYEYCGITYFAHMDKVLGKNTHPAFDGTKVIRTSTGDVPDYLCAWSTLKPFIGEAKGRFSNISFASAEFEEWRKQFTRIQVIGKDGSTKKVKGYIVGTKLTTEINNANNKSRIMAEDPETIGEGRIGEQDIGIGRGCMAIHYSRLVSKLGLNLLASSLDEGFVVPEDIQYNLPVWECSYPPLAGEKFVGGFISESEPNFQKLGDGRVVFRPSIIRLGQPSPSFFGIRESTFRRLRMACLGRWNMLYEIQDLPDTDYQPSNIAWLRDGSITGPLELFTMTGIETF